MTDWNRLADALIEEDRPGYCYSEESGLVRVCRRLAREDAAQEQTCGSSLKGLHNGRGECRTTPPVARAEQALDPAIVEECEGEAWQAGVCNRQALNAALRHYESRVAGPLRRELADEKAGRERAWEETAKLRAYTQRAQELTLHHGDKRMELMEENDKLRAELAALKARPATEVDGERRRFADELRHAAGYGGASNIVTARLRADEMRRIATLLEQPAPARKSIGRRWVLTHDADVCSAIYTDELQALRDGIGFWVPVLCDLVPVSGEKP